MSKFPTHKGSGGTTIAFPDVCKVPAPPAPFVPVPYPNVDYQRNLRKAQKVDALAAKGDKKAKKLQEQAISNLSQSVGDEAGTLKGVISASGAVKMGYTLSVNGIGRPLQGKGTAMSMGTRLVPSQVKVFVGG